MNILVFDLLIVMLFASGISMAAVGLYARRYVGRVPAATPFILLMFCAAAWSIIYALDLLTLSLPLRIFYHNLRFLFLPFFSILELWLVLEYVNRREWIRKDWAALALVIPVTAPILALTSPWHTLFRYNFSLDLSGPVPVLSYSEGILYLIYFWYTLILLILAIILLITESRRQGTLREMPTLILLVALAFPTVINYLSQFLKFPFPGINLTPAVLWMAAVLYIVALFRYRFLDIIPIARSRLIEALSKPVLVLDMDERVIDMNPAAASLFSRTPAATLGRKIGEIVPDWPEFLDLCREKATRKRDLVRTVPGGTSYYIGSVEPLLTHSGFPEGHLVFLQDVTDLKKTEAALREKTEELDQYFSTSLDLFCIADTRGYFRRLNPEWEKSLGYTLSDLEGQYFLDFVHPDDLQATRDAMAELKSQNAVLNFTNRYRHRDGTYRWIEWKSFPKGEKVFAAARDITPRKEMEEALRESETKFRLLITLAPIPLGLVSKEGDITFINNQFTQVFGYTPDEIPTLERWYSAAYPDEIYRRQVVDAWTASVNKAAENGTAVEPAEYSITCRNGEVRNIIIGGITIGESHLATFIDITERRKAEVALRESEEKYRNIIEEMQDIFYRTDLAGRITMLSPSAARIAGYSSIDDLIGRDVLTLYADPADRDRLLAILKEKGSVDSFPTRLRISDGSLRFVTTSSHFYRDAAGMIRGVEGVIHDITEQRRAEDALRMANKKLNLLSSITRHDIRNQLMALMAFLELSQEAIGNPEELADFIRKNQKIATTISDQITFTKEYEDFGVKAPSWQDLHDLVDRAAGVLPVRNIRIEKEIAGVEIFADPLVEKVFYNLIDNSLRYGGGTMTTIRFTCRAADPALIILVEDDGVGIPERDKKVIFEKGFGKNTGLGLYLSREILAITGITIEETGEPGHGARFELTVPKDGFRYASP